MKNLHENKHIALLTLLISLLGVTPAVAKQLQIALKDKPLTVQTFNDEVNNVSYLLGNYNNTQIQNIIARTLFVEGNAEGHIGREAIATVIYNRAGGNPKMFADICLQPGQYSCWNKLTKRLGEDFVINFPTNLRNANGLIKPEQEKIWFDCIDIANQMILGKFRPIANYTSYLNPKTASEEALRTWGKKCKVKIGNHNFGYVPEWDGYKRNVLKNTEKSILKLKGMLPRDVKANKAVFKKITVKPGDTFYKIAKRNNMSIKELIRLNPNIKDISKLKIGQQININ